MGKYGNIDGIATLTNDTIAIENIRRLKAMAIKEMERVTTVPKQSGTPDLSVSGQAVKRLFGTK